LLVFVRLLDIVQNIGQAPHKGLPDSEEVLFLMIAPETKNPNHHQNVDVEHQNPLGLLLIKLVHPAVDLVDVVAEGSKHLGSSLLVLNSLAIVEHMRIAPNLVVTLLFFVDTELVIDRHRLNEALHKSGPFFFQLE
jgi:hypothetical protein